MALLLTLKLLLRVRTHHGAWKGILLLLLHG